MSVITLDGRGVYFDELRARGVPIACAAPAAPRRPDRPGACGAARRDAVIRRRDPRRECAPGRPRACPKAARRPRRHGAPGAGPARNPTAPPAPAAPARADEAARERRRHRDREPERAPGARRLPAGRDPRDRRAASPTIRRCATARRFGPSSALIPAAFLAVLVAALRPEKRAERVRGAGDRQRTRAEPSVHGLVVGDGPDTPAVARAVAAVGRRRAHAGVPRGRRRHHARGRRRVPDERRRGAADVGARGDVGCPAGDRTRASAACPRWSQDGETGLLIPPDRPSEMATALVAWRATRRVPRNWDGPAVRASSGRSRSRR